MEIISIEKRTFEAMAARFEQFAALVERYCCNREEKLYDSQDVCLILRISPRTLQTLRNDGSLPFTRIRRKTWYRPEDVKKLAGRLFDSGKNVQPIRSNRHGATDE